MEIKVDSVNWEILKHLQINARISMAALSKKVGLTAPAVVERIKKMEDIGIIRGYYTQLSYIKTGYQLKAIITLKVFMGRLKPFLDRVSEFKEVINCYRITGNENIIMEVVLKNQKHLEQFIDQLISYGETKTHIVLSNKIENAPILPPN
ncbi:Lrp/AsnC family transcriptional regulator [Planktosalinus lacus]|uniref:AsnC family transcriptional regulator n=1 Tax=Planktosalinus lacus TaxID=1526573 RepID=A0A8J2Y6J4_9FLAO|nr:Lrp/AsnC family transcriptional regulator [Planktosalinus lacus]GGD91788.1 AsnC family transcriptional regulator [Planktosalinus lacus]